MREFLSSIPLEVILAFLVLNFLFCFLILMLNISDRKKIRKLTIKYNKFMNGLSGANIEQILENSLEKLNSVIQRNRELESHINNIDRDLLKCVQKVGVIRFNAFENVGSDLSFSIAILDCNDNGLVISGIYARDSSSTYAKPVAGGKSKYALSAEEIQAIEMARKGHREKLYTE